MNPRNKKKMDTSLSAIRRNVERALEGDPEALYFLGVCAASTYGLTTISDSGGLEYFEAAADKGHVKAMVRVIGAYLKLEDDNRFDRALPYVRALEDEGSEDAYKACANFYSREAIPTPTIKRPLNSTKRGTST